jgi:hypothetical protein
MAGTKANLDWLADARAALNADPAFRRLGSADFNLGLMVGGQARIVTFEAFAIAAVTAVDPADLRDADIVIDMPVKDWNAYLRRRAKCQGGSLLSLDLDRGVVRCRTPLQRLLLERYNRSVQALLDCGAALAA